MEWYIVVPLVVILWVVGAAFLLGAVELVRIWLDIWRDR